MTKGIKIDRPAQGRRFAIGDIHGCFHTFRSLLEEQIQLTKEDQLFLLGDLIDKGKHSKAVLDYTLKLIAEGFLVYPLMGNHEYFVLRDIHFASIHKTHQLKDLLGSKGLLTQNGVVDPKYLNFIQQLPYYYELDQFVLVHAGLNFNADDPFADKEHMIYARNFKVDLKKINNRTLVHGHNPVSLKIIKKQIEQHPTRGVINLDNGCVYHERLSSPEKELGHLCGLDLDTLELFSLKNID